MPSVMQVCPIQIRQTGERLARREKQLETLSAMEKELRGRLMIELERVAKGENSLFFVTRGFNPHGLPEHMLPAVSRELSELASKCLDLADSLGEAGGAPVSSVLHRYLGRASNLADHHRPGAARLARELLADLRTLEA
jgi:hypothetical protein